MPLRRLDVGSGRRRRPTPRTPHLLQRVDDHLHKRLDFIREEIKGLPQREAREHTHTRSFLGLRVTLCESWTRNISIFLQPSEGIYV